MTALLMTTSLKKALQPRVLRKTVLSRLQRRRSARHSQRGVGLIEALVAVMLLGVSLLGLGLLQVQTLQHQRVSYSNTVAQLLSLDMAERIRANLEAIDQYDDADTANAPVDGCSSDCAPAELADQDIIDWRDAIIGSTLTSGVGSVEVDERVVGGAGIGVHDVSVQVQWSDPISGGVDQQTYRFEVEP
ncbi:MULTISPECIES: type IV pilus modification protein PilV [unclassified Cobetia]|uniref:type IV pilus modification protein PilV n=1 Tax=unclassified Cobetia TaxID=2609414 RepID=UPI00159E604D|nr:MULTISPECIES: type IV pilus modification protein PilV [unclassified Cobetia]MCO7233791.1 type IV pilus modification protein PilV [Cobetia sp. Dlab-2-AX]MCO7236982.1 type IV pilus modification protein PilV [Cobetia sp. Dlab-2-U]NVN57344.1 type IV pilus modification protein PilV [bacterium Scap17]